MADLLGRTPNPLEELYEEKQMAHLIPIELKRRDPIEAGQLMYELGFQIGVKSAINDFIEKCQDWNASEDGKERRIPIIAIWHITQKMRKETDGKE